MQKSPITKSNPYESSSSGWLSCSALNNCPVHSLNSSTLSPTLCHNVPHHVGPFSSSLSESVVGGASEAALVGSDGPVVVGLGLTWVVVSAGSGGSEGVSMGGVSSSE